LATAQKDEEKSRRRAHDSLTHKPIDREEQKLIGKMQSEHLVCIRTGSSSDATSEFGLLLRK
jgi:hypothetical protein